MFIKLLTEPNATSGDERSEAKLRYFDANTIIHIEESNSGYTAFCTTKGHYVDWYATKMTADELVEAVILARMNPAMCLPSPNVGKDEDAHSSTGSLHWKANEQQRRKKSRRSPPNT